MCALIQKVPSVNYLNLFRFYAWSQQDYLQFLLWNSINSSRLVSNTFVAQFLAFIRFKIWIRIKYYRIRIFLSHGSPSTLQKLFSKHHSVHSVFHTSSDYISHLLFATIISSLSQRWITCWAVSPWLLPKNSLFIKQNVQVAQWPPWVSSKHGPERRTFPHGPSNCAVASN